MREYGIDLMTSDMSWRRFCVLYAGLSPDSLTCLHWPGIAERRGAGGRPAEDDAWRILREMR